MVWQDDISGFSVVDAILKSPRDVYRTYEISNLFCNCRQLVSRPLVPPVPFQRRPAITYHLIHMRDNYGRETKLQICAPAVSSKGSFH